VHVCGRMHVDRDACGSLLPLLLLWRRRAGEVCGVYSSVPCLGESRCDSGVCVPSIEPDNTLCRAASACVKEAVCTSGACPSPTFFDATTVCSPAPGVRS
jgi:hypothetical protein